ncbi:MAG: hypothetical protein AAF639_23060 [Chloroflexota bacterium]
MFGCILFAVATFRRSGQPHAFTDRDAHATIDGQDRCAWVGCVVGRDLSLRLLEGERSYLAVPDKAIPQNKIPNETRN